MFSPLPDVHSLSRTSVILVHPQYPGNVGAAARGMANMGLPTLNLVGKRPEPWGEALRLAKHAQDLLQNCRFFPTLERCLATLPAPCLKVAATARSGSASRPHPLWVREAMEKAGERLRNERNLQLALVFGTEADGLSNEDVGRCDWVVSIPSDSGYRSVNLAQSVLLFAYEIRMALLQQLQLDPVVRPGQRQRLIEHILQVAETCGFILPEDPHKMRPRLEALLAKLPPHIEEVETFHGLLAQVRLCLDNGGLVLRPKYQ